MKEDSRLSEMEIILKKKIFPRLLFIEFVFIVYRTVSVPTIPVFERLFRPG